jgi:predicted Zn-ribbon and HTH transcriptional regulator
VVDTGEGRFFQFHAIDDEAMDEPEVKCDACGWEGFATELFDGRECPQCESSDICDYDPDQA